MSSHTFTSIETIRTLKWAAVFTGFWALLSQNQGWELGVLFIFMATWCACKTCLSFPNLDWKHLPGFLMFFLQRLVVGGVDVALRTVSRKCAVNPQWADYKLRTGSTQVSLTLSAIVCLLPGTLAAKIDGQVMCVHLLDKDSDWQADIVKLESSISALFRTPLVVSSQLHVETPLRIDQEQKP